MNSPEDHPGEEGRETNIRAAEYQALLIEAQAEAAAEALKHKPLERASKFERRQQDAYRAEVQNANTEAFEQHKEAAEQVEIYGRLTQLMGPRTKLSSTEFDSPTIRAAAPDGNRVVLRTEQNNRQFILPVLYVVRPPEGLDVSQVPLEESLWIPKARTTKVSLSEVKFLSGDRTVTASESGGGARNQFDMPLSERLELLRQYFPALAEAAQVDANYSGPTTDNLYEESIEETRAKQRELGGPWGEGLVLFN